MKRTLITATVGCAAAVLMSTSALANNAAVEQALQSRPELAMFYQGLVSTGVINELKEGHSYTVFAPTNAAFAALPTDKFPCFYSAACKPQAAEILRSHIVEGSKGLHDDISTRQGDVMSVFSINDEHHIVSEPRKDNFAVDGHAILSQNTLPGDMLYVVDGVLATPRQMSQFTGPIYIHARGTDLPPRVQDGAVVTINSQTEVSQ